LALGNMDQAAEYYDRVLQLDAQNGRAHFDRGLVAMVLGQPYQDHFAQAKQLDPTYYEKGQQRLADIERFVQTQRGKTDDQQ